MPATDPLPSGAPRFYFLVGAIMSASNASSWSRLLTFQLGTAQNKLPQWHSTA